MFLDIFPLNIYGTCLDDRQGNGVTPITSWTFNVSNTRNRIEFLRSWFQRLVSTTRRHCMAVSGVNGGLSNDVTCEARPLCNMTRC